MFYYFFIICYFKSISYVLTYVKFIFILLTFIFFLCIIGYCLLVIKHYVIFMTQGIQIFKTFIRKPGRT